ncbi:Uncharacterised protein [uncultured archaeon]|nr:Uncharacterised protein [uncultured archaeon]
MLSLQLFQRLWRKGLDDIDLFHAAGWDAILFGDRLQLPHAVIPSDFLYVHSICFPLPKYFKFFGSITAHEKIAAFLLRYLQYAARRERPCSSIPSPPKLNFTPIKPKCIDIMSNINNNSSRMVRARI